MKILVTGGAGFIGSHLVERLVKDGHRVVVIDNESTGRRENVPPEATYMYGDITRPADLEPVFSTGFDAVCHIAGQVSLIQSFIDPLVDLRTNVEGTVHVLQLCLKYRVHRLLYASSMTIYGNTEALPIREETPSRPISYYGITKYAGERYVHTTAERIDLGFDFQVTSFRMFNVYGPRQVLDNPYQGVLGIFLGNMLRNEPITIYGDGNQLRDFVYISDVVEAWVNALNNPVSYGRVFNIGSGLPLSINQLTDHVLTAFDRRRDDGVVVYAPGRPGEQRHVEADIVQARSMLDWEPRVSFDKGLAETVQWARRANVDTPHGAGGNSAKSFYLAKRGSVG